MDAERPSSESRRAVPVHISRRRELGCTCDQSASISSGHDHRQPVLTPWPNLETIDADHDPAVGRRSETNAIGVDRLWAAIPFLRSAGRSSRRDQHPARGCRLTRAGSFAGSKMQISWSV